LTRREEKKPAERLTGFNSSGITVASPKRAPTKGASLSGK